MLRLARDEQEMLEGKEGPARQKAMELLVKYAEGLGADIYKVVAKAEKFEDNVTVLELIGRFLKATLIATSFGPVGIIGRTLSPLMGGYPTYATAG